jgi:hypothetical protein
VDPLYGEKAAEVKAAVAEFESTLHNEVRYFEPLALEHFNRDPEKARGLLTGSVDDWSARALQKLDELYTKIGVLEIELPGEIYVSAGLEKTFSVQVVLRDPNFSAERLVPEKTLLGPHYAPYSKWSRTVAKTQ